MTKKVPYLSSLTPLRGIAALLVAIFHFQSAIARFIPASVSLFFEKCYLMVDFFFIMSGFIIFHVYGKDFLERISKKKLRTYLVARFARIYPLHLFTLILLVILVWGILPPATQPKAIESPMAILTNALLLHSFGVHRIYTWNIPSWSISSEVFAYLMFPLLALLLGRGKKIAAPALVVLTVAIYLCIMFILPRQNPLYPSVPVPHNLNTTYDYGFLRGLAGFVSGMLLCLLFQQEKARNLFAANWLGLAALILTGICLHFGVSDLITVIFFNLLVITLASNHGLIQKAANGGFMQFLGDISYSIYLMQIFLQVPFAHGWRLPGVSGYGRGRQSIAFTSGALYCLLYLVMLIGISSITYYAIEQPCRRWINRRWGGGRVSAFAGEQPIRA